MTKKEKQKLKDYLEKLERREMQKQTDVDYTKKHCNKQQQYEALGKWYKVYRIVNELKEIIV